MAVALKGLSKGEKLVIQRRRDGATQAKAARRHKVSVNCYRQWEADVGTVPDTSVGKLAVHEQCFVARHRKGMTLDALAKKIKRCRWWVRQMESGRVDPTPLVEFWK